MNMRNISLLLSPLVTNVTAEQVDFEHVLICYDAEDADGDSMTVSVITSSPSMYQ
mgnify:CR=1 FL=1